MPKLSDFWSNQTPWDCNLTDFEDREIEIVEIEETKTKYGRGFLVHLFELDDNEPIGDKHIAVTSNTVVVDQLDAIVRANKPKEPSLPIRLRLIKERGKDQSYYMLVDLED